ncbi:MAG: efflux RND transporter periplasmic adaptor subunit [Pseudomonadota bacterium]
MRPVALWKQGIVIAVLGALGALGWQNRAPVLAAFGAGPAPALEARGGAPRGIPVITAPVTMLRDDLILEVVGTGRARRSITLRSKGDGEILGMPLRAGSAFGPGDLLLELRSKDETLAVALAETRLEEAERVLARFRQLTTTGTASTARLDEVVTAAEIARLELEQARDALNDRALRAPFAGVAGLPEVEEGAWVEEGDAIASFDDRAVILVEFALPEAALARLAPGLPVTATTPSVPGRVFEGAVAALDSRVVAESRSARVRVAIPNADDALRPGVSFTVRIALEGADYPAVPELAVQFSRGSVYLWRVTEGAVDRVGVRMVSRRDGAVLVEGPIRPGERVVVEGTQRLRPGRAVVPDGGEMTASRPGTGS